MSKVNQRPAPIETAHISLPDNLRDLIEQLARNLHELRLRAFESGSKRAHKSGARSVRKLASHVAFDELAPAEKEHYYQTASETLKATYALGYRVEHALAAEQAVAAANFELGKRRVEESELAAHLKAMNMEALLRLWQSHTPDSWAGMSDFYSALGNRILKLGEPLFAYDVLSEGLNLWPRDVRLRQLQALALARSGVTQRANELASQLLSEGHNDEETLGLLARTHKDLWSLATRKPDKRKQLRLAYKFYNEAHERSGGYYSGINVATMALLLGERERAVALARKLRVECLDELKLLPPESDDRYWPLATLGEAALIMGELEEAEVWYGQAGENGQTSIGQLTSTRRNARLILEHLGGDKKRMDKFFRIPNVAVFSGHMIDRPGRLLPRFPAQLESVVRAAIEERLTKHEAGIGYASAACGSDILFLETLLELQGKAYIVLPYGREQFKKDSVEIAHEPQWVKRFESVLTRASDVLLASEQPMEESALSFEYTNMLLHGLANIRAERFETELVPMAVWDGKAGDGPGGTASVVERWRKLGYEIELINLEEILHEELPELSSQAQQTAATAHEAESAAAPAPEFGTRMMALLFADAVHFSKLREEQIPRFVKSFLGAISRLPAMSKHAPEMKNTWGDGLYFVFNSVRDAGLFALELADLMATGDWAAKGLPSGLNLRIALHAGPVYSCLDPITERQNFSGTHVSRAARIEPVTPPGQVYASQEFAALAAADRINEFKCEYVGQTPLAKSYGTFPTYHVRRTQQPAAVSSSEKRRGQSLKSRKRPSRPSSKP
ncbi:MAG TPA: TRAFs-binding domain-containing protein [Pyrinomonadaceae bacterium]